MRRIVRSSSRSRANRFEDAWPWVSNSQPTWACHRPADHPPQARAVAGVGAVRVALFVGERVVLAVVGHPVDHRALQRHRPEDRQRVAQPRARLERAVGEQAVEAHRDAHRGEHVHDREDRQVARAEEAGSTAAPPATITPRNGITTAAMFTLRSSRVTYPATTRSGEAPVTGRFSAAVHGGRSVRHLRRRRA